MWWFWYFSFRILTFAICSSVIRPVLKQACLSENILGYMFMNRAINISLNASCLSSCRQNGWVTEGFGLNVRRRLDCVRYVWCTYDTHSQSERTCVVGWQKTPSFSFCQVDMYGQGSRDLCQTRVNLTELRLSATIQQVTHFRSHFESSTVYKSTYFDYLRTSFKG